MSPPTFMGSVLKVRSKCRKAGDSFALVMLRHLAYRARGKRILATGGVTIKGLDNVDVRELLEVGMGYVGFVRSSRQNASQRQGSAHLQWTVRDSEGLLRLDIGEGARAEFDGGYVNANCIFVIMHGITVGEGCAISWGCQLPG